MYDLIIGRGLNKKKVTVCIILLILLVTLATISGIRLAEHHEVKKTSKIIWGTTGSNKKRRRGKTATRGTCKASRN